MLLCVNVPLVNAPLPKYGHMMAVSACVLRIVYYEPVITCPSFCMGYWSCLDQINMLHLLQAQRTTELLHVQPTVNVCK